MLPILLLMIATAAPGQDADLILRGGAIYTLDEARPWASAVVIRQGRIVYVGDDAGTKSFKAKVLDLKGRMVLPGLHDSHLHPMTGGMSLLRCDLGGDVDAAVRACAARKGGWVIGKGWSPRTFTPGLAKLDALVPDRPAYLTTADGFTAWVNSRTLRLAGLDSTTGVLTGEAVNQVRRLLPKPTEAQYREAFGLVAARLNGFGITSVVDANAGEAVLSAYQSAQPTVRVVAAQTIDPRKGPEQVDELIARRDRFHGPRFRAGAAKLFLDGEIDQDSAALLDGKGRLFIPREDLNAIVRRLDAEGFLIHMHAMGDGAVRAGLDAIEAAVAANGPRDRRHQLAHLGVANPDDLPRFGKLGVAANFTPIWAQAKDAAMGPVKAALGPVRSRWIYPFGSIAESGGRVVASSDWPSPSMNPFEAMQVALTRQPLDGSVPPEQPEERLTLKQILAAYTRDAAWAAHEEETDGTIAVGKAADLAVLDRNLFEIEATQLHEVRVLLTLLDGKPVYRAPGWR